MKKRSIFLVILLLASGLYAQKIPYMTLIDGKANKYMDNTEITIGSWKEYSYYMMHVYGENSQEYQMTIPDAKVFKKFYKVSFIPPGVDNSKKIYNNKEVQFMIRSYSKYPMVGVSYKQCLEYCKWRTEVHALNQEGSKMRIEFTLPSQEDYKIAEFQSRFSLRPPLSEMITSEDGKLEGITDNVEEFRNGAIVDYTKKPMGFRCIGIITEK